jgi:16S rRNA (cytosine1402-N4)-methyltransferase
MDSAYHIPVLCEETLRFLLTDPAAVYVDATTGGGGHAEVICRRLHGGGRVICCDVDRDAIDEAARRLQQFGSRATFLHANFRDLSIELDRLGISSVAGILFDLGVSSHQLDDGGRGFSYRGDGPLDMRMDRRQAFSGLNVVNDYAPAALANLLRTYGEERHTRRIVGRIIAARPLHTTGDLARAVERAVGRQYLTKTLARVFQAVRIEVNRELHNIEKALVEILPLVSPGGRMVVIAYHSLEDRIVKEFFKRESATSIPSGNKYIPDAARQATLRVLTRKPVKPGDEECRRNPRARSAKLRTAERLEHA